MAGHSKWANIKFRKAAQDTKRGKLFTKLIREITIAARTGGGDAAHNPRLRTAMDKALAGNMTRDTIERAIKRGAGGDEGVNYEEIRYEGYAPGGVAVLVECQTDNRNRTVGEVRHCFTKHGGNLGTDGSVAYLFKKRGVLSFPAGVNEDRVMEIALDAGADDVNSDDGMEVTTAPEVFAKVREAFEKAGFKPENAELTLRADTEAPVDEEQGAKILKFLEALEDLDDVQNVYCNADFPVSLTTG